MNLLTNQTTIGSGAEPYLKGERTIFVSGTLTGGTLLIEVSPDAGVTWFTSKVFTDTSVILVENLVIASRINDMKVRANLSVAGTASVTVDIF